MWGTRAGGDHDDGDRHNKTRLYDRDRGLFKIRRNDELIEEARRDAEDRMVEAARENNILQDFATITYSPKCNHSFS